MDGWKITSAKARPVDPLSLYLERSQAGALGFLFAEAARQGAVITHIQADSEDALRQGQITVTICRL